MPSLFSETGLARFNEIVKPGLLCAFDFDGTLAPIVKQPENAQLSVALMQRLQVLSVYAPVAIITGRSLDDIRGRVGFETDFMIGNHGIEGLPGWEARAENYRQLCRIWHENLADGIAAGAAADLGLQIENKTYSLSVHYRLARDVSQAELFLRQLFERLVPIPRIVAGKYVFNLVPQDADDKGSALEQLMQISGARSVIYVGDDVTDEDVFKLQRDDLLSVRVGRANVSAAQFHLQRRHDMANLIDEMIRRLRGTDARNWVQLESTIGN